MADKPADPAKLKLVNVRLSFPDIFEPKSINDGDPRYSAHFLIDKKNEELINQIKRAIWTVAKEHWGDQAKKIVQSKKFKNCLHDGAEKDDLAGYSDEIMFLSASSPKRPLVIDLDRTPLTKDDRRPYGGCYVVAIVRLWCQDNNFGVRVNAELMGVQFYKDGEPFGAAPISEEEFDDLSEDGNGEKREKAKGAKPKPDNAGSDNEPDDIPF